MFTFGRGYAQGLSFLQRLKSWGLIDWGQRLKLVNGVLVALFVLQVAPQGGLWTLGWAGLAAVLAVCGVLRSRDRALILAALVLGGLAAPWEKIIPFVSL
jgi:PTS system mannose-specific IID component